jgi:hypothetical protein
VEDEAELPSDGLEGIWRDMAIEKSCDGGQMGGGRMGEDIDRIPKARESKLKRNLIEVEGWREVDDEREKDASRE